MNQTLDPLSTALGVGTDTRQVTRRQPQPACVTRCSRVPCRPRGDVYRLWESWEERGLAHNEDLLWPDLL